MLATQSKKESIMAYILQEIQNGVYKPGDKIPCNKALAEGFGVSNITTRAAVLALVELGILCTYKGNPGKGTVVAKRGDEIVNKKGNTVLADANEQSAMMEYKIISNVPGVRISVVPADGGSVTVYVTKE